MFQVTGQPGSLVFYGITAYNLGDSCSSRTYLTGDDGWPRRPRFSCGYAECAFADRNEQDTLASDFAEDTRTTFPPAVACCSLIYPQAGVAP